MATTDTSVLETSKRAQYLLSQIREGYRPTTVSAEEAMFIKAASANADVALQERLYSVVPRSGAYTNLNGVDYNSARGNIASIKVITLDTPLPGGRTFLNRAGAANLPAGVAEQLMGANTSTFNSFLLSDYRIDHSEKVQITSTFGDNEVAYFFGKNPVIVNISGILVDSITPNSNWFQPFLSIYDDLIRGSQLAKNFELVELVLPTMTVTGSILSVGYAHTSSNDTTIPFSMQMYAKKIVRNTPISKDAKFNYPVTNTVSNSIFNSNNTSSAAPPTFPSKDPSKVQGLVEPAKDTLGGVIVDGMAFEKSLHSDIVKTINDITNFVQQKTGSAMDLISKYTNPINAVLRDITEIATQANAVALLVEQSAADIGHLLSLPAVNLRETLSKVKTTAGTITRLPESVMSKFKSNFKVGKINSASAILKSGPKANISKIPLFSSGKSYTAQSSFSLKL